MDVGRVRDRERARHLEARPDLRRGVGRADYFKARAYTNDAEAATSRERFDELHDQAHTFQKTSWVLAGVAGIGAGVSAWLWHRALAAPATLEVTPTADGASVSVGGRF